MGTVDRVKIVFLLALLVWGSRGNAAPPAEPRDLGFIKGIFDEQVVLLEKDLASRMLRRPETLGEAARVLELGIDLRLLERWMLARGAAAPVGSTVQVAWRLRADILKEAVAGVELRIAGQGGKLTDAEARAADRLHQLSFTLPDVKNLKEMDEVSARISADLTILLGVEEKLPAMRPPFDPGKAVPVNPGVARTLSPAEEVGRLTVSPQLRQQLLSLVGLANSEAGEKDPAISSMLLGCIDLARGLQYNLGVLPAARLAMEAQLAEGIALYLDPRTREIGKGRIAAMGQYRQLLSRIGKLNLRPEVVSQLTPLLAYVRDNPDAGAVVLGALEKYEVAGSEFDGRPKGANALAGLQRSVGDLERQYAAAHGAFIGAALEVPKGTVTAGQLEDRADDLARIVETLERLDRMPANLELLATFKPRPAGVLEKRVVQAAQAAASPTASPARVDANRLLADVDRLAHHARELGKLNTTDIPSYLEKRWAGGRLAAVEARWKSTVAEQASLLSAGAPMDSAKVDRLMMAVELVGALREGIALEGDLAESAPLERWVDWRLSVDALKPLLRPYPDAVSDAFGAYVSDNGAALEQWPRTRQRYRGIISLIHRAAGYRQACAALPEGAAALAAQMATPLDAQPFANERYAGYCVWIGRLRPDMADEALGMINRKLGE